MELEIKIKMNAQLFLKDPESTHLGKKIVGQSILSINDIGFEDFTFKKLAFSIQTTEASIYRYFENKHVLLVYIISLYWNLLEYQVFNALPASMSAEDKIKTIIRILTKELEPTLYKDQYNLKSLFRIVVSESNKVYLTKNVGKENDFKFFKPYKDFCSRIASILLTYNSEFRFAHSLSSTLIETAHLQYYFMEHLPALTDFGKGAQKHKESQLVLFLENLVFSSLIVK